MANKTQHFNLTKPTPEEFYSVEDQNGNMDIIDDALKNHKHSASDITSDILSVDRGGTGSDDLSNITVGNTLKLGGAAASDYQLKDTALQWYDLELMNEFNPSASQPPQYMRDNGGWVQVLCSFNRSTPPTSFEQLAVLPQGYRPAKQIHVPVIAGLGTWSSYVTINPSGSINFYNGSVPSSGWPTGALGFNVTFKTIV